MFERTKDRLNRSLGSASTTGGSEPSLIDQLENAVPAGLLSLRGGRRSYYDEDREQDGGFDFDNDDEDD